jgi:hypothetical protein
MAHGVYPAMDWVDAAGLQPVSNPPGTQTEFGELAPGYDSVLPPGERRNRDIDGTSSSF